MILSARAIASEIADSDAGERLSSHCDSLRAARMQAAIKSTRFLPSSTLMSVARSSFVRYLEIRIGFSEFEIFTASHSNSETVSKAENMGGSDVDRSGNRGEISPVQGRIKWRSTSWWGPPPRRQCLRVRTLAEANAVVADRLFRKHGFRKHGEA